MLHNRKFVNKGKQVLHNPDKSIAFFSFELRKIDVQWRGRGGGCNGREKDCIAAIVTATILRCRNFLLLAVMIESQTEKWVEKKKWSITQRFTNL